MAVVVRLGTLTFNDGPDVDGDEFIVSDIDGWTGIPPELVVVDRPTADGAQIVYGRNQARTLTVSGYGIGDTANDVWRVRTKLEAAVGPGANANLEVDEPTATYRLVVRLVDRPRIRDLGPQAVEFQFSLLAADPAKTVVP